MEQKRSLALFTAPLLVLVVLSVGFWSGGMYPFGGNTLAWCDMNHQVVPLLMEFRDILLGKTGFFLNLQNAGGMNFWGVFFFFLSSPFSFLSVLVPKADFYLWMNVLVLAKTALAACSAAFLFLRVFAHLHAAQVTCFAALYACSGFTMMYYQNAMWLDIVCLFPLLMLGTWRLYTEQKPFLFLGMLCAVIVVNYYLSAMIFFWLVLFFAIFCVFAQGQKLSGRRLVLLGLCVAAALLTTAVVWLPSLLEYFHSGRTGNLISNLSSGSFFPSIPTTLPIWYGTGAAVAAVPLFLLTRRKTDTDWSLFLTGVLLWIPLVVDPIDRMWHLGSYQAFPVRYGYILNLTGLLLAARYVEEDTRCLKDGRASRPLALAAALSACLAAADVGVWLLMTKRQELTQYTRTLWGNLASCKWGLLFAFGIAAVFLLLVLLLRQRKISLCAFCILFCFCTVAEILFQTQVYMVSAAQDGHAFDAVYDLENRIPDNSLYRVKRGTNVDVDTNQVGALGYGSLDHYTSLNDGVYMDTLQRMGYSSQWMESTSSGGTEMTDALLALKYAIQPVAQRGSFGPVLYQNDKYALVQQPYSLPFGFVTQQLGKPLHDEDRFSIQNQLYQTFFNRKDSLMTHYAPLVQDGAQLYSRADGTVQVTTTGTGALLYRILVTEPTTLYFDCYTQASRNLAIPNQDAVRVYVNDRLVVSGAGQSAEYPTLQANGLLRLGTFSNEAVNVLVEVNRPIFCRSFGVAGLSQPKLEAARKQVETANLQVHGSTLRGEVTADKGGWLVLPMRAGAGFHAKVNGKQAQLQTAAGTFLAVRLQPGKNAVEVRFLPPGLLAGLAVSGAGLLAIAAFVWFYRRKKESFYRLEKPAKLLFGALAAFLISLLYVFPVVVYFAVRMALF